MKIFLIVSFFLIILPNSVECEILIFSPNGQYISKPDLFSAATSSDASGKTIVITSVITFNNLSSVGGWPMDRKLKVEKGGSLNTSQLLRINGPFEAGNYQVFAGSGIVRFGVNSTPVVNNSWFASSTAGVASQTTTSMGVGALSASQNTYLGKVTGEPYPYFMQHNKQNIVNTEAIGPYAFKSLKQGWGNIGVGYNAGGSYTRAGSTVAIGWRALEHADIAYSKSDPNWAEYSGLNEGRANELNVAIGAYAANATSSAQSLTAIGSWALYKNTTANANTCVGSACGYSNTTGKNFTAVGTSAAEGNTTGNNITAMGASAYAASIASSNSSIGNNNSAFGSNAMVGQFASITGSNNNAFGAYSMTSITAGSGNNCMGNSCLSQLGFNDTNGKNTSSGNTALGEGSGYSNTAILSEMNYCTFIGANARSSINPTVNSTAVGANAIITQNNQIVLGGKSVTNYHIGGTIPVFSDNSTAKAFLNIGDIYMASGAGVVAKGVLMIRY